MRAGFLRWAISPALTLAWCAVAVVVCPHDRISSLTGILAVAAVVTGLLVVGEGGGGLGVTGSYLVQVLAAAFLGPLSAAAMAVIVEVSATLRMKTSKRITLSVNLPAAV